jgi:hypothetical protein
VCDDDDDDAKPCVRAVVWANSTTSVMYDASVHARGTATARTRSSRSGARDARARARRETTSGRRRRRRHRRRRHRRRCRRRERARTPSGGRWRNDFVARSWGCGTTSDASRGTRTER